MPSAPTPLFAFAGFARTCGAAARRRSTAAPFRVPAIVTALTRPALHALFGSQRDRLFRLLYRLTGDAADAEDLLQETFLAVWRKREHFEGRGAPEGYLRRTAVRLCLNLHKRRERRAALAPADPSESLATPPDRELERSDALAFLAARVREALDELPEGPREAFLLFRYEGLSCAEIAEATGAPRKTVETRLRRATQLLAEKLSPYRDQLPVS